MTSTQIVTLIIAAYGALLSTVLAVITLVRSSRGVTVSCTTAIAAPTADRTWEFVVVQAVNKRPRPVTITEAGLQTSDGKFFTQAASNMGRKPLPTKLDFGDEIEIHFDLPELERVMAEKRPAGVTLTRAFVRDAEGKEYVSRLPKGFPNRT
jgi:hypothetical protein